MPIWSKTVQTGQKKGQERSKMVSTVKNGQYGQNKNKKQKPSKMVLNFFFKRAKKSQKQSKMIKNVRGKQSKNVKNNQKRFKSV